MTPTLAAALERVARTARTCSDPWWLIGSEAMVLHGAAGVEVADVDMLASTRDARALLTGRDNPPAAPDGDDRFRSVLFGRLQDEHLPIEIMAGLEVRAGAGWIQVRPRTRMAVELPGGTVFVPAREELIAIMRAFGRDKDMRRIRLLEALR